MVIRLPGKPQSWLDKEIGKEEEERFSIELDEARKSGRYPIHVAARLIAQTAGRFVSSARIEERLWLAVHDKSLPAYDIHETIRWDGKMPFIALINLFWDDLNTWLNKNEPRIGAIFQNPISPANTIQSEPLTATAKAEDTPVIQSKPSNPWLIEDPRDPNPEQPWYIPARYFARELVKCDSTLLAKRDILAKKVVQSLTSVSIKKRGGKKPFNPGTIKKAFSNVSLD